MKNITISTIAALTFAGGMAGGIAALTLFGDIAAPSAAWAYDAPESPEVPAGAPETPAGAPESAEAPAGAPEATDAPVAEGESPTPETTDAPVGEDEGEPEEVIATDGSELSEAERDSITEGLICHMEGWVEACRAPDLIDMGLAPLPDGTPVAVVTEEQVQEPKPAKAKRPGVPKTGY